MAGGGLQLTASANFSDDASAKNFADNFNKTLALARQDPNVAQTLLMAQGLGVQIPSAQSTDKQAKLTLSMPLQAIDAIASMAGGGGGGPGPGHGGDAHHSQPTVQRWAGLTQMSNLPQWPNYQVVVKALGQPNNQTQNAVLDLRKLMQTKTGTFNVKLLTSQEKQQYRLTGIRVDYNDDPQGRRAIRLYFRPQTQQLIGIEWYESSPRKIGPPKVNQQNRSGGGGRPTGGIRPGGGGRPGGKTKGGNRPGGFGTKGGATKGFPPRGAGIRPQPPSTTTVPTAIAPPQSVAEAQQRLKGTWTSTTRGKSKVTISFGDNNQFATDAGSGPKRGNYRILNVSGNRITFWGLRATLTLNGANEFSVQQTSMVGVVPKGTFRK
jgi:hypothetical protein